MPSSGYTVIFENLIAGNKVFVLGFTLKENEVRKTIGEIEEVANAKNSGERCNSHSFTEERDILAWLHNNNKIDATLCMVEDKKDLSFENNKYNTKPSDFVINLLDGIKT
jgi:recombinational DNA repair protein RecR